MLEPRSTTASPPGNRGRFGRQLALLLAVGLLVLAGCDWTQAGFSGLSFHNPSETALTADTVPKLRKDWSVPLGPGVEHDPIVVRGMAVVSGLDATSGTASLTGYRVANGEERLATVVASDATEVTDVVAVDRRAHVAVRRDGGSVELVAVDLVTGAIAWRTALPPLADVPTGSRVELLPGLGVAQGRILVSRSVEDADGLSADPLHVQAIVAATGAVDWHVERRSHAPSVIVSRGRYVALSDMPEGGWEGIGFSVYDGRTGASLWDHRDVATGQPEPLPGILLRSAGGRFYGVMVGSALGGSVGVDDATGRLDFIREVILLDAGSPDVVVGRSLPFLKAYDTQMSGTALWLRQLAIDLSQPTFAGDLLYVTYTDEAGQARLEAMDPGTGASVASIPVDGVGTPIVSGGRVFLRHGGVLDAYAPG